EKMFYKFKNAWEDLSSQDKDLTFAISKEYKKFLDIGKTERECTREIISQAKAKGFRNIQDLIKNKVTLKEGMKIYSSYKGKTVALFVIGKEKIEKGMNIVGSHIDSPRLDLKAFPLYEDGELALLKTHYYGELKNINGLLYPYLFMELL
ncbi:unnamed protein product, partial [marine sediment metagenome]